MSTSVTTAFINQYEREVHETFQRQGSYLLQTIRRKPNVKGSATAFQKVGKGAASTKARHGVITPMNQDHTTVVCTLEDYYAGDWIDRLDEAKTNVDERGVIARGGAWALGRKADDQILTALDATTQSTVSWTVTSAPAIRNSLLSMVEALNGADVPPEGRFGLLTPRAWSFAMTVEEFANSQFIGDDARPFLVGAKPRTWLGINWMMHTGLPGKGTNAAKVFVYHTDVIGYGSGEGIKADITWHGDRAAHFVNHMMSGGACLIDDTGVIEGGLDDTAAIPTS